MRKLFVSLFFSAVTEVDGNIGLSLWWTSFRRILNPICIVLPDASARNCLDDISQEKERKSRAMIQFGGDDEKAAQAVRTTTPDDEHGEL